MERLYDLNVGTLRQDRHASDNLDGRLGCGWDGACDGDIVGAFGLGALPSFGPFVFGWRWRCGGGRGGGA